MDPNLEQRLSKIETLWSLVRQAHGGAAPGVSESQEQLLERYGGAVHRYLLGAVRDADAADELFQEFCLRFLRGDFKNANPQRGRFRMYVKTALLNLIVDHQRLQKKQAQPLHADGPEPAAEAPSQLDMDRAFRDSWRAELLDRTWQALAETERLTGNCSYTVLRLRMEQPGWSSAELAEELGRRLAKPLTVGNTRTLLSRARDCFADLLLRLVIDSLDHPSHERLGEELADLKLLSSCQEALKRAGLCQ
jgi:RNA polymerase sigma-70 factor (ECF subfamily)